MYLDINLDIVSNPQITFDELQSRLLRLQENTEAFRTFSIIFAYWIYKQGPDNVDEYLASKYFELLDTLIILFGPDQNTYKVITKSDMLKARLKMPLNVPKMFSNVNIPLISDDLKNLVSIKRLDDPSLSDFKSNTSFPLLIDGLISHWPAIHKWTCPTFWLDLCGHRYFPVEIGRSYLHNSWSQNIIRLADYLEDYVFKENTECAYIAQHNWLFQVPDLMKDFEIIDFCYFFSSAANNSVLTHLWFGMANTFTPLHFDKYNNFFSQVVGRKHFIIVSSEYSALLSSDDNNTCKLEEADLSNVLKLNNVPHYNFIIEPGQALFIPHGWWHQVRSLTFSISISFWF